jgi:hypothetical protein
MFLMECINKVPNFFIEKTRHFTELMTYISTLIQGKHANIDMDFWVREAFTQSNSRNIAHFNYQSLLVNDPDLYNSVIKIAAQVFNQDETYLFNAITEGLKRFSSQENDCYSHPNLSRKTLTNGKLTEELSCLQSLIHKHRFEIVSKLEQKYPNLPRFYHKYGQNWKFDMVNQLKLKLALVDEKIIIYGAGQHTEALLDVYDFSDKVVAICDSNEKLWGGKLNNILIIEPSDILQNSTTILISSQYFEKEIANELNNKYGSNVLIITLY